MGVTLGNRSVSYCTALVEEIRSNNRGSVALDLSKEAANVIEDLTRMHQLDQSEIVRLRREIERITE